MPTVLRVDGFQLRIYPDDHNPPHVHAYRAGAAIKIALGDAEHGVQVIEVQGMSGRMRGRRCGSWRTIRRCS